MKAVAALLAVLALALIAPTRAEALGQIAFIPAPSRVDVAFDQARNTLYITSGSQLLRYRLSTATFDEPITLGGTLAGVDISPDGNLLAIGDAAVLADGNGSVHIYDIAHSRARTIEFDRWTDYENGSYSVAFGRDGALLVTTTFNGSSDPPVRRFDLANSDALTIVGWMRQNGMLAASADRSVIAWAGAGVSNGPLALWNVAESRFTTTTDLGTFVYEISPNRDGSRIAVPVYTRSYVLDSALQLISAFGDWGQGFPQTVAYSPTTDIVYGAVHNSSTVALYEGSTGARIDACTVTGRFDSLGNFAYQSGRMKVSPDGSRVFVTTEGGVSVIYVGDRRIAADAPKTTVTGISSGWVNSPSVSVMMSTSGGGSSPQTYYSLGGGALVRYATPLSVTATGTTDLRYFSRDAQGRVESVRSSQIRIDTGAPVTTATIEATYTGVAASFRLIATDAPARSGVAYTYFALDDSSPQEGTLVHVTAPGDHTVRFWSVDVAGNVEAPITRRFAVLRVAPGPFWLRLSSGTSTDLSSVYFVDAETGWAAGSNLVIMHTGDGGATWTTQYGGWYPLGLSGVTANGEGAVLAVGSGGFFVRSADGGATWHLNDLEGIREDLTAAAFADADTAWAVGAGGTIVRSDDAGKSWTPQSSGTTQRLSAVSFHDAEIGMAVGEGGTALRTADGGATWDPMATGQSVALVGVDMTDSRTAWIAGAQIVMTTRDGGATWLTRQVPLAVDDTLNSISAAGPDVAVAVSASGSILRTDDGGETWTAQTVATTGPNLRSVQMLDEGHGYAVGSAGAMLCGTQSGGPLTTAIDGVSPGWVTGPVDFHLVTSGGVRPNTSFFALGSAHESVFTGPVRVEAQGTTVVAYRSIDCDGEIESTKTVAVRIDSIPPVTGSDAAPLYFGPAKVRLSVSDGAVGSGAAHTNYRLDDGPQREGAVVDVFELGAHTLEFWSTDVAGNVETSHTCVGFSVLQPDFVAPTTSSNIVATYTAQATIYLAADDGPEGAGVAHTFYRLDGAAAALEGTTVVVSQAGEHTIEYWSVDAANPANVEEAVLRRFVVEPAPLLPRASLSAPGAPSRVRRGHHFTVTGSLKPRHAEGSAAIKLRCYRYQSGHWVLRKTVTVKVRNHSSYSEFSVRLALPYTGRWRIRSEHSDAGHRLSVSHYRYVRAL